MRWKQSWPQFPLPNMARRQQHDRLGKASSSRLVPIVYSLAAVLALAGLADAVYLTVLHLTGQSAVCGASAGCSQVLASKYAQIGPVPVASLGLLGYFTVFSLAIFAAFGYPFARKWVAWVVGLLFLGTLWFLYLQTFVLHAFCPFCLASAAVTFVLAGLMVATTPGKSPPA